MNDATRAVALNERFFGQNLVMDSTLADVSDPRAEEMAMTRWGKVVTPHGEKIIGIRNVPTVPVYLTVDDVQWRIELMDQTKGYTVPPTVAERIQTLASLKVPLTWWLWGEEVFESNRPTFTAKEATYTKREVDAMIQQLRKEQEAAWQRQLQAQLLLNQRKVDPILFGVIPTANMRGIWVHLGTWFH